LDAGGVVTGIEGRLLHGIIRPGSLLIGAVEVQDHAEVALSIWNK
jgi:hypothetical protein